jgi:hypothetical protein
MIIERLNESAILPNGECIRNGEKDLTHKDLIISACLNPLQEDQQLSGTEKVVFGDFAHKCFRCEEPTIEVSVELASKILKRAEKMFANGVYWALKQVLDPSKEK